MAWPGYVGVVSERWTPDYAVQKSAPSLNGFTQRTGSLGDIWTARVVLRIEARRGHQWNAFVGALRGGLTAFSVGPVEIEANLADSVTGLSEAASAGAAALTFNTAVDSSLVPAQGLIGMAGRLHLVTGVTINGAFNVTLGIWPQLRVNLTGGTLPNAAPETSMYFDEVPDPIGWGLDEGAQDIEVLLREDLAP